MKKLIMLLLMLATMATSSKAEDLDSMYTQEMLPIGTEVPDVMLDSIHNVSLKSMRGRYVVLHFWEITHSFIGVNLVTEELPVVDVS